MGLLQRLTSFFSRSGRDENRLRKGMEQAEAKRPAEAVAIYDSLVNDKHTSPSLRAKALLNRALAHSSLKDDAKAITDLEQVIAQAGVPENVLHAARNQLVRVRQRVQRGRDRLNAESSRHG